MEKTQVEARAPASRMPPAQRRALVVAAGARLFAERGYAGTTIDDIASAAGVTKPIVYRHFDSKKDLYLTLLAKHREDLPTFLEGAAPAIGDDFEGTLREVLDGVVRVRASELARLGDALPRRHRRRGDPGVPA